MKGTGYLWKAGAVILGLVGLLAILGVVPLRWIAFPLLVLFWAGIVVGTVMLVKWAWTRRGKQDV